MYIDNQDEKFNPNKIYWDILSDMKFYNDIMNANIVYAEYLNEKGYYEFRNTQDPKFKAYVEERYLDITGEMIAPSFAGVLKTFRNQAILNERTVEVLSRIGGTDDEIAYFMANKKNTVCLINKDGYKFYKKLPRYKFLKRQNSREQVMPKFGSDLLKELKPFLNMSNSMRVLCAVNIVQYFIPTSSHFLTIISSERGSGKSTFTKILRTIIDPARAVVTTIPDNADSLKTHLGNNLFACFDNTQPFSQEYSDILCGAVTGTFFTKRKLYTNTDEIVLKLHNVVLVNGIDIVPKQSDLLQRSLLFKLNKISDKDRKNETEIYNHFQSRLPYIFGAIIASLIRYFQIKDTIKVEGSHRMADAYSDCYIISTILGVKDEFLKAFQENQNMLQTDYAVTNPIVSAVISYMKHIRQKSKKGSVEQIYSEILPFADSSFPKSSSAFSRKIKHEYDSLKAVGYSVSIQGENQPHSTIIIKQIKTKGKEK